MNFANNPLVNHPATPPERHATDTTTGMESVTGAMVRLTELSRLAFTIVLLQACSPGDAGEVRGRGHEPSQRASETSADPAIRTVGLDSALLAEAYDSAASMPGLRCLLVARHGEIEAERCFGGPGLDDPANVKSVSKSIVSALVGIAIAEGTLDGVNQPIAPYFRQYLRPNHDPRKEQITIGHLLSMQSGLERTSGPNYGAWVTSENWVRYAITRPMVEEPGGPMLYSTGNSHLLSAILTDAAGMSTLEYARSRLFEPLGIDLVPWMADPQGIYFGGNEMRLTPRQMVRFGELYRNHGRYGGRQIIPENWIEESWTPRTRSRWSGNPYGYGWFRREVRGYPVYFAWGYGGQFIFIAPDLELTVVTTSNPNADRNPGHTREIHGLLERWIVPSAEAGAEGATG